MSPRPERRLHSDPAVLAELLDQAASRGRPPVYAELGEALGLSRSSVHDAMVRLRHAGALRSEPRIALTPAAQLRLARVTLGLLDCEDAARELLQRPAKQPTLSEATERYNGRFR